MSVQIILKKSSTPGSIPLPGDLVAGELAVNLADRKLYANNGGAIVSLGVYVNATAPSSPTEGDVWYDTANDRLKTFDGSAWSIVGGSLADLPDVTLTGLTDGELLVSAGGNWINKTLGEAGISATGHTHSVSNLTDFSDNSTNWNTAYSWGNHASVGYLTSESDTLDSVTDRGATTTNDITIGALNATNGDFSGNMVVTGNLTVNGTTTTVNTTEVSIGDNILLLNADEAGTPSQNAGFEVERGTTANVSFVWNEADDLWDFDGEGLGNVVVDGGTY